MKKPWSISTTVRNPDRIRSFLETLTEFEGNIFNEKQQINFQIALIKRKLYKPTGLSEKLLKYYDLPSNMTLKQATEIFNHMRKTSRVLDKDPGLRGRTSIASLSKMGLVFAKKKLGTLHINNFGKKFLRKEFDMAEIFLEYFFKWTTPNPYNDDFSEKDGFNIQPFIATLHIIKGVNKKWKELGYTPKGISKEEFNIFVLTTIHFKDIQKTMDEIIELRKKCLGKNKQEQLKIKALTFVQKAKEFFNDSPEEEIIKNLHNLRDYGDNAIRYFKLTRFFYIRGGGFFIDLEPRRLVEIDSLLKYSDGEALQFKNLNEYVAFIEGDVIYPWETKDKLTKIIKFMRWEIEKLNSSLTQPMKLDQDLLEIKINKFNEKQLKLLSNNLWQLRKYVQEYKTHLELSDVNIFGKTIENLENIHNSDEVKSIYLEYLITRCLHAINDALNIQPNYPVGDDNRPTFTAPANVPDIECRYKSFNMVCEVTMLCNRDQWFNEGQPVMRHLRDFEIKNKGNNLCLFIAPKIHRDTFNTFNLANKYEYEGSKQKIVPLSISQFLKILKYVLLKKQKNKAITHQEFMMILESLYEDALKSSDVEDWSKKSNALLNKYFEKGVV